MRAEVSAEIDLDVPYDVVWDYFTDWPRQAEWIPFTRVEALDSADRVGGTFRAWTGLGPLGFWDTMTITDWRPPAPGAGSARCEVLHTGRVVRGEGEFAVTALGPASSRFLWWERVEVPLGPVGAVGWKVGSGLFTRGIEHGLRRMRANLSQRPPG